MSSLERMALEIIGRRGGIAAVMRIQDATDPFTQAALEGLLIAAGCPEEVAGYLSECMSLGICSVMAEMMPDLKIPHEHN